MPIGDVDKGHHDPVDDIIDRAVRADPENEGGVGAFKRDLALDRGQFAQHGFHIALQIAVIKQADDFCDWPPDIGIAQMKNLVHAARKAPNTQVFIKKQRRDFRAFEQI